jgi:arsenate reductase-like glutaredoxin family protein
MEDKPLTVRETVNAAKERIGEQDLKGVLEGVTRVVAAKGKKIVELDLAKDKPSMAELAKVMLGPTGNLRAPTIRAGKKLLVGFNPEIYGEHLG